MVRAIFLVAVLSLAAPPAGATIFIVSAPAIIANTPNHSKWDYDVFIAAGSELLTPGSACFSTIPGGACDGLLTLDSAFGNSALTHYAAGNVVRIDGTPTRSANLNTSAARSTPLSAIPETGTVFLIGIALITVALLRPNRNGAD